MERHDLDTQVNEELVARNRALRKKLEHVTAERDAFEMAIIEEGFEIGTHGAGYCITDESLARRDARSKLEELSALFEVPKDADLIEHIERRCADLRRQAEESIHENSP